PARRLPEGSARHLNVFVRTAQKLNAKRNRLHSWIEPRWRGILTGGNGGNREKTGRSSLFPLFAPVQIRPDAAPRQTADTRFETPVVLAGSAGYFSCFQIMSATVRPGDFSRRERRKQRKDREMVSVSSVCSCSNQAGCCPAADRRYPF